jgi:hypothetical protein
LVIRIIVFIFVAMEQELLNWSEKLDLLEKGKSLPTDQPQSVYAAIRKYFKGSKKKFSIRTHPDTKQKHVIRLF